MDLQLNGKAALVTGASRGIGLAVVRALVAEGVRVVAAARTPTTELKATGATLVAVDLSDPASPERLATEAVTELGGIDILVNNVGGGDGGLSGGFLDTTDAQWAEVVDLNFFATVRVTRAALPALLATRGAIVNVSSVGARVPHSGPIAYTTAKAALTAFGKALADEFGPRGVRVNTVSPGRSEPPCGKAPPATERNSRHPWASRTPISWRDSPQRRACSSAGSSSRPRSQPSSPTSPHHSPPRPRAPTTSSTADPSKRPDELAHASRLVEAGTAAQPLAQQGNVRSPVPPRHHRRPHPGTVAQRRTFDPEHQASTKPDRRRTAQVQPGQRRRSVRY